MPSSPILSILIKCRCMICIWNFHYSDRIMSISSLITSFVIYAFLNTVSGKMCVTSYSTSVSTKSCGMFLNFLNLEMNIIRIKELCMENSDCLQLLTIKKHIILTNVTHRNIFQSFSPSDTENIEVDTKQHLTLNEH